MKQLLTIAEVAKYLRLSVSTVYKYTSARKIPFIKDGNRILFDMDEINRWLDSKRVAIIN